MGVKILNEETPKVSREGKTGMEKGYRKTENDGRNSSGSVVDFFK